MRSGAEIEAALRAFVKRWNHYQGSERSEAQTFLNELFDAYGTDGLAAGALFEDFKSSAGSATSIARSPKVSVAMNHSTDHN